MARKLEIPQPDRGHRPALVPIMGYPFGPNENWVEGIIFVIIFP